MREEAIKKVIEIENEEEEFKNLVTFDIDMKNKTVKERDVKVNYKAKKDDAQEFMME